MRSEQSRVGSLEPRAGDRVWSRHWEWDTERDKRSRKGRKLVCCLRVETNIYKGETEAVAITGGLVCAYCFIPRVHLWGGMIILITPLYGWRG